MSNIHIIASYLPIYRTPPHILQAIDWTNSNLEVFGYNVLHAPQFGVDSSRVIQSEQTSVALRSFTGSHLHALARRYVMLHPEMVDVTDAQYKLAFANSMATKICMDNYSSFSKYIHQIEITSLQQPDDMLDFEYVQCTASLDRDCLLARMRSQSGQIALKTHILKRASDRRYRYMRNKRLKRVEYWLNPNNWIGFSAGFVFDFYIYWLMPRSRRHAIWYLPQVCYGNTSMAAWLPLNKGFVTAFTDPDIQKVFARAYMEHTEDKGGFWPYHIMRNDIHPELDAIITEAVSDPEAFKQKLLARKVAEQNAKSTQRQQRPVHPIRVSQNQNEARDELNRWLQQQRQQ